MTEIFEDDEVEDEDKEKTCLSIGMLMMINIVGLDKSLIYTLTHFYSQMKQSTNLATYVEINNIKKHVLYKYKKYMK